MGRVVTFQDLAMRDVGEGIGQAPVTAGDAREMTAALVRIAPGRTWRTAAPHGSDLYLFARAGCATIAKAEGERGEPCRLDTESFAVVGEDTEIVVVGDHNGAELLTVLAPPAALLHDDRPGFRGTLYVAARASAPTRDLPKEKKRRILFVDDAAARSQRGHAMIVEYGPDTVTGLHHHPNAESLFVVLSGALTFTVDGKPALVKAGQAAWFGCDDPHGLRVADGAPDASFLEFHIPAAYTTVKRG